MRSLYRVFEAYEPDGSPQLGAWTEVDGIVRWRCPDCWAVHQLHVPDDAPGIVLEDGPARIVNIDCCRVQGALALTKGTPTV